MPALLPTTSPSKLPSWHTCQIKHIPAPAPSKSNGGAEGNDNISKFSSVIIHSHVWPAPAPATVTSIGSAVPSIQIVVGSGVVIVPASETGHLKQSKLSKSILIPVGSITPKTSELLFK